MPRWFSATALALLLAGCQAPVAPPPAGEPGPAVVAPEADVQAAAAGNNAFTLALYAKVAPADRNVILSPFSVRTALGMTAAGARGETLASLQKLLHFTLPDAQMHPALGALGRGLAPRGGPNEFAAANALWPAKGVELRPEFTTLVRDSYGAGVEPLDFAAGDAARLHINDWTKGHTRGRIPELLKRGVLKSNTTLVLTNAVYFQGVWATPFAPAATRAEVFTTANGERVPVPTMHEDFDEVDSHWDNGAVWLRLPYAGGRLAMVLALPAAGQPDPLAGLSAVALAAKLAALKPGRVSVGLPKFQFKADFKLLGPLTAMGLVNGDFTGIGEVGVLYAVEHAATIEVDEKGTVATAATAVGMFAKAPPHVAFDRPFAFLIEDRQTGAVLFLGRVADPR